MIQIFAKTDKGEVRENNQDSYRAKLFDEYNGYAVVCDGMGGANAGNVASDFTANLIAEYLEKSYRPNLSENAADNILRSAVETANIKLFELADSKAEYKGMGTTVVAALFSDNVFYLVHVGDSRAYLIDDNEIKQITVDHSVVQTLLETGQITKEEAKHHPKKNIITRAVGVAENVTSDFGAYSLNKGQKILICSDGLTNYVSDETIKDIINNNLANSAEILVDTANEAGGGDNITAVVISI